jgi:methionine sulfoxide reductase heme-binding subunit
MKRPRFTPFQIMVHLGAWVPLVVLAQNYFKNNLTVNPIQALEIRTGDTAIILLILSLACTPLNTLFRVPQLIKVRRPLGLYAYFYASIHLLIFLGLDYGFDPGLIIQTIGEKPFVIFGLISFIILSALALTSLRGWVVRLGKRWKYLHRLVYLVNVLVVLHFGLSVKGDFFRMQGQVFFPWLAAFGITILLILRIPAVRKRLAGQLNPYLPNFMKLQPHKKVGLSE